MRVAGNTERLWVFIKKNVIGLTTVASGVITLILMKLGLLPVESVPGLTLCVVCLLATSELVERSLAISRLQATIESEIARGAEVEELSLLDDAFHYVARRFKTARRTVDHVAFATPFSKQWPERNEYDDARNELLRRNNVRYRYIGGGQDSRERLRRILGILNKPEIRQYRAAVYFGAPTDPPGISYLILDAADDQNQEAILYLPRESGADERIIVVRNRIVISHLHAHFLRLWSEAKQVTKENRFEFAKQLQRPGKQEDITA